jgi:hypothetical protein
MDDNISDEYKKDFYSVRNSGFFNNLPAKSEQRKLQTLRDSIVAKRKHPFYNKVKRKIPYVILVPAIFSEFSRLACYRLAGLSFLIPSYDCCLGRVFNALCCHFFNGRNVRSR